MNVIFPIQFSVKFRVLIIYWFFFLFIKFCVPSFFRCNEKHTCSDLFDEDDILTYRYRILELSKQEKDLVILGLLMSHTAMGEMTKSSKRKQTERQRDRSQYFYRDEKICTEMFRFIHG